MARLTEQEKQELIFRIQADQFLPEKYRDALFDPNAESDGLFRLITENLYDCVSLVDANGIYQYVSPAYEKTLGYAPEELIGRNGFDIIHPDDIDRIFTLYMQRMEQGNDEISYEARLVHKNGHSVPMEVKALAVRNPQEGITGGVLVARDVTERTLVEKSLIEQTELLLNITDNLFELVALTDPEGNIRFVSKSHVLLGYDLASLIGKNVLELVHPGDLSYIAEAFQKGLTELKTLDKVAYRCRCADESYIWVETIGVLLKDQNGDIKELLFSSRDITERKQSEEVWQRMRALEGLGTVAGGIAHDFNNLLMGVFGNIEMARVNLPPDHPAHNGLRAAHQALENARHLTNRLLTFAKGGQPVLETVDLRQRICETVSFHLAGSNVAARFDIPDDLWPAKADRGQITDVISNLSINAREAMPAGGTLHICARNVVDIDEAVAPTLSGDYIKLIMKDEGIGIPTSIIRRVFDPYFTTKHAGSGLGLAIVHGIVNRHKGHISIESEPNVGTTFTVFLPADTTFYRPVKDPLPLPEASDSLSCHVLIMDDEEMILSTTSMMLEELGCTVETAVNGSEAIDRYIAAKTQGKPFDVAIMDLTIAGGMGGKEAIGELLAVDPSAKVIVTSGYSSDPVLADFVGHGFSGCLAKPFKMSELNAAISRVLMSV